MALPNLKQFCLPETAEEVVELLGRHGEGALILAGGTFLHGLEARGLLMGVEALVDLQRLGLDSIALEEDGLHLGATARYGAIDAAVSAQADPALGALADALSYPPAQIHNAATAGGCLAAACPFFDLPTAFGVLEAEVTARGAAGSESKPVGELAAGLFENTLSEDQFLTGIHVPKPPPRTASAFLKLESNANDLAIVNVAVRLTIDAQGRCREPRVVLGGGVGDRALRSPAAEAVLAGAEAGAQAFREAAEAVSGDIEPMADHRASAAYRGHIARVFTRRALERAQARLS